MSAPQPNPDGVSCGCGSIVFHQDVLDYVRYTGAIDLDGIWDTDVSVPGEVLGGYEDDTPWTTCAACGEVPDWYEP